MISATHQSFLCKFLCTLGFLLCATNPSDMCGQSSDGQSQLTVERLFETNELQEEKMGPVYWSKLAPAYYLMTKPGDGRPGSELTKTELKNGSRTVVVPASSFVPKNQRDPLKVDAFELSADESKLLLFTNSKRVWRRNTRGDYWLLDLATLELNQLGGHSEPSTMMFCKFSPDGSHVAFVRDNNLYVQNLQSLEIKALTTDGSSTLINGTSDWVNEEELSIRDGYRWSPDSKSIVFWQFDTEGVRRFHLIDNTQDTYPHVISFPYPKVGERNSATRLGVVGVTKGNVNWLKIPGDPREHYLPHAEWTPDGRQLWIQQFNRLQNVNQVMMADPVTGETKPYLRETDPAWLENENPVRWLNQGRSYLWISERDGWRHAYIANVDGEALKPVTKGDFDVISVETVDEADGWLYYAASPDNATQRYLYRSRLSGGKPERVTPVNQSGWHTYDISPDAKWAIHTYSTFSTPPIVEVISLPEHKPSRLLIDNQSLRERLAKMKMPTTEFCQVEIDGGFSLDAWCIKPPSQEENAKHPLLIHVYGEPHGQTVKDVWGGVRGLWHQMLAQQGYVVASVDNRGTMSPRGRAWRKCIHRQIGILAAEEQAAAVRVLLKRLPFVDDKRVGVWGWSGGGSMSLNAIFRYPELYHTAIAVAPNADQRLYDSIYQERYMGLPQDNVEGYRDGSPITHAHNLQGNLLVVHGTGDDNGHYQGTEMLINELIAKNKFFSVMPYPARSHAILEGVNTVPHFYGLLTNYLNQHLANKPPASGPAMSPNATTQSSKWEVRDINGWNLHIDRGLLEKDRKRTEKAVVLLRQQLDEIIRVVPSLAVTELRKVSLFFSPEYPGKAGGAEFHPSSQWLRSNGRDPLMAEGVEFSNIGNFEAEMNRMPNFALHELAHAYHFRVVASGYDNPDIKKAYEAAKASGKYDRIERWHGNGKPNTFERAYAMANAMEYFAECTEAYFVRNDFFPFTKHELKRHDPEMFQVLEKMWGTTSLSE